MRLAPLAVFAVLSLLLAAPAAPMDAGTSPDTAVAAKKRPKCKVGTNGKKCRCPKGYKLRKRTNSKGKKVYQCKKQPGTGDTDQPNDDTKPDGTSPDNTTPDNTTPDNTTPDNTDPGVKDGPSGPTAAEVFADILSRTYLLRNYQVPKPNGSGTNNHSEEYGFCNDSTYGMRMAHAYEGIAYIYKSTGPWRILNGTASANGSTGSGTVEYTQESANFQEEVGKVQVIGISWTGDTATVNHPEIGTYSFAKTVASTSSCTR